jgi:hypothetical protein
MFQTFKSWTDAKRTSQATAGKPFLAAIWETGCQADSFYTSSHSTWTATGLSRTKTNWFANMASYIQSSWPLLHHLCYWDSLVVMIWTLDTTQTDWDGFVAISHHAAFTEANVTTLAAGTTTYSSETTIANGTTLRFPPNASATLIMDNKNLIIRGRLEMKPQSTSVVHTLQFSNVSEAAFVGGTSGGMSRTPVATDIGLWVVDTGILDAIGSTRTAWDRSGNSSTWLTTDEMYRVPFTAGNFTTFTTHTKGIAPSTVVGPNGVTYTQECLNATRNVIIQGTVGHKAHVFISSDEAQTIKYVRFYALGPRKMGGDGFTAKVTGRWGGPHFHHSGSGNLVEGCIVYGAGSHAFVYHSTDTSVFRDCVAFASTEIPFWWDFDSSADFSNDVTYDHCLAAGIYCIPEFRGFDLTGFALYANSGTLTDCAAVGVLGNNTASGFTWPESSQGNWNTNSGNVAHNNYVYGEYNWQNNSFGHNIGTLVAFRNGSSGILAGAYINSFRYDGQVLFNNGGGGDLQILATSYDIPISNGRQARFKNITAGALCIGDHTVGSEQPTLVLNCNFTTGRVDETTRGAPYVSSTWNIVNCGLEPNEWTVAFMAPATLLRVERTDGTSYRMNSDGTSTVISPFYMYISTSSITAGVTGTAFSQTLTQSLGVGAVTWAVQAGSTLPAGLTLSPAGVLSGTPTVVGSYSYTLQITDTTGETMPRAFTQTVTGAAALTIATSTLPDGFVGTSYSQTFVATGGSGSGKVWILASGTLPAGLGLSSGGILSGTPTTVATYNFTIRVTDSASNTTTRAFTVGVTNVNPTITTISPLTPGAIGVPLTRNLAATGGTTPYTWSVVSGSLPAGLSLASSTGIISGTPTTSGTSSFTIRCTDSAAHTNDKAFTFQVTAAVSLLSKTPNAGSLNVPYSYTFTAQNGVAPYSFSPSQAELLPTGLTLASTGVMSGTPTVSGTFNFSVFVFDSAGMQDSAAVSVIVSQSNRRPARSLSLRGLSRYAPVH